MATTIKRQNLLINFGNIVNNAVAAVKAVRATEQSRMELAFQKAVSGGMTYQAQIAFREKQIQDEKNSDFHDEEYSNQLEGAVATTKKLARYEIVRNKYKDSLNDYVNGKESIQQHIQLLQDTMETEQDPALKTEIRDLLDSSRKEQTTIEVNAIKNRATLAGKDRSVQLIDSSVNEIQSRRALATINKNDDEVVMWDETLLALNSNKSKIKIEDGLNEIAFQTNRYNLKGNGKLDLLNKNVANSDVSTPVTYKGVTYPSMKAYWEDNRGEYISSSYFNEVKSEMDLETAKIAATSAYGQIPLPRIEAVNQFYSSLSQRPEFAPFKDQIEQQRVASVNTMATDLGEAIVNEAQLQGFKTLGDSKKATQAFFNIENRLGIKLSRTELPGDKKTIADNTNTEASAPTVKPTPVAQPSPLSPVPSTPMAPAPAPTPSTTTPKPTASGTSPKVYVVKAGDTLSQIAHSQLGDASKAFDLKSDTGQTYDASNAKSLQIGTKLIIPTQ